MSPRGGSSKATEQWESDIITAVKYRSQPQKEASMNEGGSADSS